MDVAPPGEVMRLADGRALGFAQYGLPDGTPLFFFHGMGASRLTRHPDPAIVRRLGVRLIGIDRPGIGLSDPQPGRRLLDWPDDVAQLADTLGLERFAILGWSGGGAHALACAYKLPERLTAVGIVSGAAPLVLREPPEYLSAQWRLAARIVHLAPASARLLASWEARLFQQKPRHFLQWVFSHLSPTDRTLLAEPAMYAMLLETTHEVFRQGSRGLSDDMLVLARPWGFRPQDVQLPVSLWHGQADTILDQQFARYLARALPDCQARFFPEEGHFLFLTHWQEILQTLTHQAPTHQTPTHH